jgi:PhnB protein
MPRKVKPIPTGWQGATPYLTVKGAAAAIEFYRRALGAEEVLRIEAPAGLIGHAELRIGKAIVMLSEEYPDMGIVGPLALGGSPVGIHLYVEDVDAAVGRAVAAGATLLRPVADQFYGDRTAKLADPFGHIWHLATRQENVPPAEMQRRASELFG